jgi:hypothetical protein
MIAKYVTFYKTTNTSKVWNLGITVDDRYVVPLTCHYVLSDNRYAIRDLELQDLGLD